MTGTENTAATAAYVSTCHQIAIRPCRRLQRRRRSELKSVDMPQRRNTALMATPHGSDGLTQRDVRTGANHESIDPYACMREVLDQYLIDVSLGLPHAMQETIPPSINQFFRHACMVLV